jgi:hypothetical protein
MANQPYRTLRVLLVVLSLMAATGGFLMILGGRSLVTRLFLNPPELEISTLFLFTLKEIGGLALMLSLLLYFAWRDPVRNVSIIDAFIVGLCILAVTPLVSLWTLDVRRLYPGYIIWGRCLVRFVLAAVLFLLRPREARKPMAGF